MGTESIWMIEKTEYDQDRIEQSHVDADIGWFTTYEDAKSLCDKYEEAQRVRYDKYVGGIRETNAKIVQNNIAVMEDWKNRVAASVIPINAPYLGRLGTVPTYETYRDEMGVRLAPIKIFRF